MPPPTICFVTGRLAADALRAVVEPLGAEAGFAPHIATMKISVAALMTPAWLLGKLVQLMNATTPMLVTLSGIVTLFRPVLANAWDSMRVMLGGIVTLSSLLQRENAEYPMLVTLFGMVTFVRLAHPVNACRPMLVMLPGMATPVRLVQL